MENRLREIRAARKLTLQQVAEALNTYPANVGKYESGETQLTPEWLERFGAVYEIDPIAIITRPLRRVRVRGPLQAGHWTEDPEWPEDRQYEVAVPDDPQWRSVGLYAGEVCGPSMRLRYPEGTVLVMAPLPETREELEPGKRYHVRARRADGTVESTVKTLVHDEAGKLWLKPESDHPDHQAWIALEGNDGDTIRALGRVVFAVTKE